MGRRAPERPHCCINAQTRSLPVALAGRELRGDVDIHVDAHGTWHYNQSPVSDNNVAALFASMLVRDDFGDYWLATPTEVGRISVTDAPLVVDDFFISGHDTRQSVHLCNTLDQLIAVSAAAPLCLKACPITGEDVAYVTSATGIEAKLTRAVYHRLLEVAVVHEGEIGVWSEAVFFPLCASFELDA